MFLDWLSQYIEDVEVIEYAFIWSCRVANKLLYTFIILIDCQDLMISWFISLFLLDTVAPNLFFVLHRCNNLLHINPKTDTIAALFELRLRVSGFENWVLDIIKYYFTTRFLSGSCSNNLRSFLSIWRVWKCKFEYARTEFYPLFYDRFQLGIDSNGVLLVLILYSFN